MPRRGGIGRPSFAEAATEFDRCRRHGMPLSVAVADLDALLCRAAEALYEAKRRGRDRVVCAGDAVCPAASPSPSA